MRVLIKGMSLPTSCYDCNCFIRDSDGSDYCCLLMEDIEDNGKRVEDCPLVPVPPGRLIDANALIIDLMDRGVEGVQTDDLHEIQQAVMDAPTVVEAEEGK